MKNRPLCSVCLIFFFVMCLSIHVGKGSLVKELRPSPLEYHVKEGDTLLLKGQIYRREIKDNYQILYLKNNSIPYQKQFLYESKMIVYDEQKTEVLIGQKLEVTGALSFFEPAYNPGNFDRKLYYQKQDIHASLWAERIKITEKAYSPFSQKIYEFRRRWKTALEESMSEKGSGVLAAMILGEKGDMDAEMKELYQVNGIGHILAISGLHLSFIGVGLYRLLRKITGSYGAGGGAGIAFLLLYVFMTGFTVSVVRAFIMFLFRVGADIAGRHYDSPTALSVAAVFVLVWRPLSIYDGGFWLSFGAVFAVIVIFPVFSELPFQGLWASISINLVLFPVILYYFFEFPVYSVLLNLFVIPLMSVLLFLGIFGSLLCVLGIFPGITIYVGKILFGICEKILWLYEKSCNATLNIPGARLVGGQPGIWQIVVYYVCLTAAVLLCLRWRRRLEAQKETKKKLLKLFYCHMCGIFIWLLGSILLLCQFENNGKLQITVLDVGQGDGIFIRGPGGSAYLVDGGSSDVKHVGKYRIEPFLKSQGIKRLEYVFVSHGDSDHINGIAEMLEREAVGIKIKTLVFPTEAVWDEALKELAAKAAKSGVRVAVIEPGQKTGEEGLEITCLQPGENYVSETGNAASMILKVTYGEFDMLLTGDVEGEGERLLVDTLHSDYVGQNIEVLKAAHHGSKNSSTEEFLKEVNPMYTIISAGKKNRYGHPHEETIDRLKDIGSRVYSTKECGAVKIDVKDDRMTVQEFCK